MSKRNKEKIYEIAILGRVTWNLHSLNNEGTVGNVTEPRNIRIIDPKTGDPVTTDGISGEMLKHIHAEKMWEIGNKSNFCEGCKKLEPERGFKDKDIKGAKDFATASDKAIQKCVICDIHGFLFPEGKITGSRSSVVEFGWALGLPINGEFTRDIHTHARHAIGEKVKTGEEISTQMVYHRPTRSGVYAIVSVFQPWRIGLNNVTVDYVKNIKREERYKLVLKAYQAMFARTEGAMTSTRLPHATDFSGVIIVSKNNVPVPVISPLKENYIEEVKNISKELDNNNIEILEFNSISEFVGKVNELLDKVPYSIKQ
jgi:CRISPR-associated protein Cst2